MTSYILELIDKKMDKIYRNEILLIGIVMTVGLIFRVIITPWGLPSVASDVVIFFTEAFNFSHNNYELFNSRFLWPFVLSIFLRIFEFDTYVEYSNLIRGVSIVLSICTIPIIYLIGKKFFEKKYSILVASFFAFNVHIIENSTWGITEPLFLLLALGSFYFMLNYNSKYTICSFILAGLSFDTRVNGIVILIIILIGYSMKIRPKRKFFLLISIGLFIFIIISIPNYYEFDKENSPILNRITGITKDIEKNNLNPHLVGIAKLYLTDEQLDPNSENFHKITVLETYLFAITKEAYHIVLVNIQFLIFLLPIGLFFIFKNRVWKEHLLILGITISIIVAIPQYTLSSVIRNLLLIVPFGSIIATIGIQNIVKNSQKKNLIITLIISGLIISSIIILYPQTDNSLTIEKERFGKYVSLNYSGKIAGDLLYHVENNLFDLTSIPLKYKQENGIITDYSFFSIFSENQFVEYLKNNEISYLIIDDEIDNRYIIFEDVFQNEKKYPYLIKVFDSNQGYNFLKVKIFKVSFKE